MRKYQEFDQVLALASDFGASDIHLSEECSMHLRISGCLRKIDDVVWTAQQFESFSNTLCTRDQLEILKRQHAVDLAYSYSEKNRYRINLYREKNQWALAARVLPSDVGSLENMNLPPILKSFSELQSGLVLVTGATGSGKSTTLAAIIDRINQSRQCHILTIEDPIEYEHKDKNSLIHQREIHRDADSYAHAVRSALRQDPDVILVGEMRDLETMRSAMSAAETGHLVLSTLHTNDSVGAINRIVGAFPADEQTLVRQQLSLILRTVITQRLLPDPDFKQRFPSLEVLIVNSAIANLIRCNKPEQIYSIMESSKREGMQSLEQALAERVNQGQLELGLAMQESNHVAAIQRYLKPTDYDDSAKALSNQKKNQSPQRTKKSMTIEPH